MSELMSMPNDVEEALMDAVAEELVLTPSVDSQKRAKGLLTSQGLNSTRWRELEETYPYLEWKGAYDDALLQAYWNQCEVGQKKRILQEKELGRLTSMAGPIRYALANESSDDASLARRASKVYFSLQGLVKNLDQKKNRANNNLLAVESVRAVRSGIANTWRFVCMPKTTADYSRLTWEVGVGDTRYDTLTRAIRYDQQVIQTFTNLQIEPSITLVLDDWEIPFLRALDVKTGINTLRQLDPQSLNTMLTNLSEVREATRDWITNMTANSGVNYKIIFFSELLEYEEFCNRMESMTLRLIKAGPANGIVKAEEEFIRKADPIIEPEVVRRVAGIRIAQYAGEGAELATRNLGIFLASEYPTVPVWKKLTLMAPNIPTLFYALDKDIKNI